LQRGLRIAEQRDRFTGGPGLAEPGGVVSPPLPSPLETALAATSHGVIVQLACGSITLVNPAAERLLGLGSGEGLGRDSNHAGWKIVRRDGSPWPGNEHPSMVTLRTGQPVRDSIVGVLRPDGTLRWVAVDTDPVPGPDGQTAAVVISFSDVTPRVLEERRREHESEALFRSLFENAVLGLYRTTPEGEILLANPALCAMLGYESADDLRSRNLQREGYHPDYRRDEFKRALETRGSVAGLEARWRRTDGSYRWIRESATLVRDGEGRPLYYEGTVEDVTERKEAEEALTRSEVRLRALTGELDRRVAERTAALEEANRELEAFSYSVSHELRTPLRAIDGCSALAVRDSGGGLDAEGRRRLAEVRWNAQRMGRLLDDVLEFVRVGHVDLAVGTVDMTRAASEALSRIGVGARPRAVRIGELPPVQGDAVLLGQVWEALLSNAVKFSAGRQDPEVSVEGELREEQAVYRVRDNGVGFDPAYADKLFGVFHRLCGLHEYEGSGMGLALVRRILSRHGGEAWAESSVGSGATFSFALPRTAPAGLSTSWRRGLLSSSP
jgi:PAS domain S-box-containing protein